MTRNVFDRTEVTRAIREKIIALAARRSIDACALNDGDAIVESGALDSVAFFDLIMWIEVTFDLTIQQSDLTIENLGTVDAIAVYLQRGLSTSHRHVAS
ncbi:MAG: acyl carrier protein [Acidobacteriota bacterium]